MVIKWIADFEKSCITSNFEKRGWVKGSPDDWNFYWSNVGSFRMLMSADGQRLMDNQIVNHFPNHLELTKKDLMVKHLKRYKKELLKDANQDSSILNFLPTTFILPGDYNLFTEEFKKSNAIWIMKPTDKARGIGIFIVNKLSQLKKWEKKSYSYPNQTLKDSYVISRYIENPLLIGGKKFDLRLYVLATSWNPMIAYRYVITASSLCFSYYSHSLESRVDTYEIDTSRDFVDSVL